VGHRTKRHLEGDLEGDAGRIRLGGGSDLSAAALASVPAGRVLSREAMTQLQRTVGNQAVQRLVVQRDAASDATAVAADMSSQFKRWKGQKWNRGAWWGSPRPGDTTGAKNVPPAVGVLLKPIAEGRGWRQAPSFSGGVSFHKTRAKAECDFIYHLQAP
jgi:hypothetical protein